jgi:hypothetical protein
MQLTAKQITFIALHGALFLLALFGNRCIAILFGDAGSLVALGFALGTYVLLAKDLTQYILAALFKLSWPHFDNNKYLQWYMGSVVVILIAVGGWSWYQSWEGATTWTMGLGVFLSALLFDYGIAHLFRDGEPFGRKA